MIKSDRRGISKSALITGTILWGAVFVCLFTASQSEDNAAPSDSAGQSAETPIEPGQNQASVKISFPARRLPDFEFAKCTGGTLSLDDLKGKRWVASFIFSRCTTSCPVISAAMMKVHDRIKETAPDVQFVSITVDPKYDTAEVFREYSETFTKGDRSRWSFLTGDQQQIYDLVVNGFGLYVKENAGKARMPGFEVAHSNRVVLVNEDGIPVGTFLGTREEDMVKLRRILNGKEEFPKPGPALTFTTSDNSPMPLQFQVQPVEDNTLPDGQPAETDAPAQDSEDAQRNNAPSESLQSSDEKPNDSNRSGSDPAEPAPTSAAEHNAAIDLKLPNWARNLPAVNAGLNLLATILLACGFVAIKSQHRDLHRNLMVSAFLTSVVFLVCYLTYHYALGQYTGKHGKRFIGEGIAATVYPLILWPHVALAATVPFLAVRVFQHAFAQRWDAHKRLARVTFPIWMYVSITGVMIYGMLYHWPAPETN